MHQLSLGPIRSLRWRFSGVFVRQVQQLIGATSAVAFDITAACSGFVIGIVTAAQFIRTGTFKNVLIIGADALSRYTNWRDRGKSIFLQIVLKAFFSSMPP